MQFQLDGANVGSPVTAAPYNYSWNTTKSSNGSHTLKAIAKDTAGTSTTSAGDTVNVNNTVAAPVVSVTAPAAGATVSGTSNSDGKRHEQYWSCERAIPVGRSQCGQPGYSGAVQLQLGHDEKLQQFAHTEGHREGHGGNQHDERRRHGEREERRGGTGGVDHRACEWGNDIGNRNGDGERHEQHWSCERAIPVGRGQCGQSDNSRAI